MSHLSYIPKFKKGDHVVDIVLSTGIILSIEIDHYKVEVIGTTGRKFTRSFPIEQFDLMCKLDPRKTSPTKLDFYKYEYKPSEMKPATMYEAYIAEIRAKQPKHEGQALQWHKEGRCPQCGELGRYHLSTPICSQHGTY